MAFYSVPCVSKNRIEDRKGFLSMGSQVLAEGGAAVTADMFQPIIAAITSVITPQLLLGILATVLGATVIFFVVHWGYGIVTRKMQKGAKNGSM